MSADIEEKKKDTFDNKIKVTNTRATIKKTMVPEVEYPANGGKKSDITEDFLS